MSAIVVINVIRAGPRAEELLDCLRGRAEGAEIGTPDQVGHVEVYLRSATATAEASKASLAHLLDGCSDDWRDFLTLGWAGDGDWSERNE